MSTGYSGIMQRSAAPAIVGNTVLWKPASTAVLSGWHLLRLLQEAGLPPGVINLLTGDGVAVSEVALHHPVPIQTRHPGGIQALHLDSNV